MLIWGSTWYAIKFQPGVVEPEVSLVYRCGLVALILLVFGFGLVLLGNYIVLSKSKNRVSS